LPSVHRQTFVDLVKSQPGWTAGAELGMDKGILTRALVLSCPNLLLTGVDVFPDRQRSRRVFELAESYQDRLIVLEMTTREASAKVPLSFLDFVFIDADHSYEAVKDDIACWAPKVRSGGWVGGHDYHPRKFPGVVKAVDEAYGKRVQHWPGTIWGVWT
jgi:predicted O-methyltransferase YrrM